MSSPPEFQIQLVWIYSVTLSAPAGSEGLPHLRLREPAPESL
jgi:hypothetical protein